MTETVEHDGVGWRLVITTTSDHLTLTIEHQLDDDWLPTQRWTEANPDPKHRKQVITESARAHGWITPSDRWPRIRKDGTLILENLFPYDWERIIRDATTLREDTLTHAGAIDRAWRLAINTAGTTGGMRIQELAEISGRGRHAIYRMRTDDLGADDTALLTEIRNAKADTQ